jgi:hypothetical protein
MHGRGERIYFGHPALRPFGAVALRPTCKFAPGKFVNLLLWFKPSSQ